MILRQLTDDERAVFDRASRLAATLRSEGRQLDPEAFQRTGTDRALYDVQYQGAWLATLDNLARDLPPESR